MEAAYDRYADWYEEYVKGTAAAHTARVDAMLATLLGPGNGRCLDLCCGTGMHGPAIAALGWRPFGVDLSAGQLRHAVTRMPVVTADAARLPLPTGRLAAVACMMGHTDLPDYPAVLREAARVLRPGGRLVHIGVHPCFVGPFVDRVESEQVVLGMGYRIPGYRVQAGSPHGIRARLGAWHLPLSDLLSAVVAAGLVPTGFAEGGDGAVPDLFGFAAAKGGR